MQIKLFLDSVDATTALAQKLASRLQNGDTILLYGDVGAGKTHFARQIISTRLAVDGINEDIPSPTFTLVQTYETTQGEIWHADLYRLTSIDEIDELGLEDSIGDAICLIEWPEKIQENLAAHALQVHLETCDENTRNVVLEWQHQKWDDMLHDVIKTLENPIDA
ncbi:tRNA (N6-adenosine(37)-N6)-threonylcarbamoyltransferase complex ATPase TsaE [Amylibacter kogurei]|uniref:tRNA threonylcarbamoyladenosine biosynthesis protein TsaE n=1 Tax=Paramylibacter kogurei TaxID=1889778 RepID=A0A2G5KBZ0_9RHOB|nr:tRNA (adenosine(37)-N6)-threonylcarbamoyltransferase complex ATPase subunit type 1 TsaE [Amylibacter kogurei]PIB26689.1 tRNA (N6-adenosine(37)-N6)-threonylcarbamoyltransferase complex ATPase TsaE [Amylibacter kogurei]